MKDNLFDTEEKINDAISSFTNLINSDGWKLVVAIQNKNIELLQIQLESGSEEEKYDDVKRLREKLSLMKEMINLPQNMIERFQSPTPEDVRSDPFDDLSDVEERKRKQKFDKDK